MSDRRSFLTGLVSLPLIGGGLTLIGRPSAPLPLIQAAALPSLDDPRQRARYAWAAFSAAMDDVTAGSSGWRILGAGKVRPCGKYEGNEFLHLAQVHFEVDRDLRFPSDLIVERHRDIEL